MTTENDVLVTLYNELVELNNAGKESEATALLEKRFPELPENLQGEILARMYAGALVQKVEAEDTVAAIQEGGLKALDALEVVRKQIEERGDKTQA